MNIVIVGPGTDPERWGTYFTTSAENDGHNVVKFSYRLGYSLEAFGLAELENRFSDTIDELDSIDIFVYNCIGGFYPGEEESYQTGHKVKYGKWTEGIMINAAMPHMMTLKCLEKMNANSKIVFLTSSASYLLNRDNYFNLAGYFGTKGCMNQLMLAFAHHNDKGASCVCLAPHIPYDEPDMAKKIMKQLYDLTMSITEKDNGKIIQCYPPSGVPHIYEG